MSFNTSARKTILFSDASQESYKKSAEKFGSGYFGGSVIAPHELGLSVVGLNDVDEAVYNLFEKRLKMHVASKSGTKTPVSFKFAGRERFSIILNKEMKGDETGALRPPAIAVEREGFDISHALNNKARYLGQNTGELTFIRKLGEDDSRYQNILNRFKVRHQNNVSVKTSEWVADREVGKLFTRSTASNASKRSSLYNSYLLPEYNKNIFEIVKIPFPKFFVANYKVTFWTTHVSHMRQIIEQFISSFDGTGNFFRSYSNNNSAVDIFTDDNLAYQSNFSDYTEEERDIKISFNIQANGKCFGTPNAEQNEGFRSYISAVDFDFGFDFLDENLTNIETNYAHDYINLVYDQSGKFVLQENGSDQYSEDSIKGYRVVYRHPKSGESILIPIKNVQ